LPSILHAPFTGALLDRFKLSKLVKITLILEFVCALAIIPITSKEYVWLLFLLLYIRMSAGALTYTAVLSLLPKVITSDELKPANEIHAIVWSISFAGGSAIGGLAVYAFGIQTAFVIDALFYLVAFFVFTKTQFGDFVSAKSQNFITLIKDGISYIKNNKLIMHLIMLHALVGAAIYDTLVTLLAQKVYAIFISIPLAIGFLNGSRSVGLFLGSVILNKYVTPKTFGFIFLLQSIAIVLWIFVMCDFYASLIGIFCVGLFTSLLWSYSYTLVQNHCDEEYYGRVIAYNDMLFVSIGVIVSLAIGFLAQINIPLQAITSILAIIFFIGFVYYGYIYKKYFKA
jgi:predicted MFS family arabinose efflux permease